ncbi:hypothetical protein HPP92_002034 [Vanilla planifolia]|uniref:Cyclin-like domain-containing protein n=1 Tax=Vanilla planifolia TaxID=51239 RepID=A0A835SDZ1_VANPL|nr:hypothetical protein HPP92_002034 [Vanilla planifolia]
MPEMVPAPIPGRSLSTRKRQAIEFITHAKKLRSNIPRRKRIPSLPIVGISLIGSFHVEDVAESSSSCLNSETSIAAAVDLNGNLKRPSSSNEFRRSKSIGGSPKGSSVDHFRRITRSYSKRKKDLSSRAVELRISRKVNSQFNSLSGTGKTELAENEANAALENDVSAVSIISKEILGEKLLSRGDSYKMTQKISDQISESSCLQPVASEGNAAVILGPEMDNAIELQIQSRDTMLEGAHHLDLESDLACPEHLLDYEGCSDHSACDYITTSEFDQSLFDGISEGDSSEVSISDLIESPDYFSAGSRDGSGPPSVAFSLFLELWEQFKQSSFHTQTDAKFKVLNDFSDEFVFLTLPDKDDEESYQKLRSRERNEIALHDYSVGYNTGTKFGDLIVSQRHLMVNWMLAHCKATALKNETLFLGVNLMDRFLSRGYFQTERNLQLLGIACVTLATRIEENQPLNSIRQRSFTVDKNVYKRCEVVSMEWLILEVLRFQCSIPTIHDFLWFYLKAASSNAEADDLSRHLAMLTLFDHSMLCFWPSTVAAGLVILACLATDNDSQCDVILETHLRSKADDLPECIQSLDWLVKHAASHGGTEG